MGYALGLIPARGGSKGIPRKNIRLLGGKPLLAWTIEAALAARRLGRVILSTEDEEIAAVGRAWGVEVPFMRPTELAQDDTPTLPVVRHALETLALSGDIYDAVCLLQPTNPFRAPGLIDACIERFEKTSADTLVTVLPVPPEYNPHWVFFENPDGGLRLATGEAAPIPRRQELPPAFHREGSVYVVRSRVILERGSLFGARWIGYPVDAAETVNLDTPEDWERAERMAAALAGAVSPS